MNDQRRRRGQSQRRQRDGFLSYFDSIEKIAVALAAVVALVGGIVGLVLKFQSEPPPKQEATMRVIDSFPRQFGDFLAETGQDIAGYSEAELDQKGREYEVEISVEGLRNKSAEIVWTLLGDLSDLQFDERKEWSHQFLTSFKPPTNSFKRTAKIWIQYPPLAGRFRAEMVVEYPKFTQLVTIKTKAFAGRPAQPRGGSHPAVTKTVPIVTTIPASVTTEVATIEDTTTVVTTIDGTTTTTTVPTSSTVTTTTTIPARTQTVMKTVTVVAATAGGVPVVRPPAKLAPP